MVTQISLFGYLLYPMALVEALKEAFGIVKALVQA